MCECIVRPAKFRNILVETCLEALRRLKGDILAGSTLYMRSTVYGILARTHASLCATCAPATSLHDILLNVMDLAFVSGYLAYSRHVCSQVYVSDALAYSWAISRWRVVEHERPEYNDDGAMLLRPPYLMQRDDEVAEVHKVAEDWLSSACVVAFNSCRVRLSLLSLGLVWVVVWRVGWLFVDVVALLVCICCSFGSVSFWGAARRRLGAMHVCGAAFLWG